MRAADRSAVSPALAAYGLGFDQRASSRQANAIKR